MFRRHPTQIQLEPDEVRNHIDHFNRQVEKLREQQLKEQKAQKAAKQQLQTEDDAAKTNPGSPDPMHDVTLDHDAAMERILLRHERMGISGGGGTGGQRGGGGGSALETPPPRGVPR